MIRRHVHSVGADVPVVTYDDDDLSDPRYLYADHQGSIIALAGASGTMIAINAYDEYGIPAATNAGRFQYTGQIWLPELGMYHYKSRAYSPTLGRFMQVDPIGYQDQFNLYAYVGNDPMNGIDPTGECQRNSEGVAIGVCPMSDKEISFVQQGMDHPHSQIGATDAEAVGNNQQIRVRLESTDNSGSDAFIGGRTELDASGVITVMIDETESPLVDGRNAETGESVHAYSESREEVAEHEIAGEARAIMRDPNVSSAASGRAAVDAENRYRERRGNPFRRQGHTGRPEPGPMRRWP